MIKVEHNLAKLFQKRRVQFLWLTVYNQVFLKGSIRRTPWGYGRVWSGVRRTWALKRCWLFLIDLQNSSDKNALFVDIPAGKFWCCCRAQFPKLAKKAFEVLVPFVTTYRCEQSFSVMSVQWKTNSAIARRQCFHMICAMALSKTEPRIKKSAASKQAQKRNTEKNVKINVGMSNFFLKTCRKWRICMVA